MEVENRVAKDKNKTDEDGLKPAVPTSVRRSSVPEPESTRGKGGDKTQFRQMTERKMSKVEEKQQAQIKEEEERVFSRDDEPIVRGTIVITVFKDHPYEVEFSGDITGTERDLALRAMMKGYGVWKNNIRKKQEKEIKAKELEEKMKEEANA